MITLFPTRHAAQRLANVYAYFTIRTCQQENPETQKTWLFDSNSQ